MRPPLALLPAVPRLPTFTRRGGASKTAHAAFSCMPWLPDPFWKALGKSQLTDRLAGRLKPRARHQRARRKVQPLVDLQSRVQRVSMYAIASRRQRHVDMRCHFVTLPGQAAAALGRWRGAAQPTTSECTARPHAGPPGPAACRDSTSCTLTAGRLLSLALPAHLAGRQRVAAVELLARLRRAGDEAQRIGHPRQLLPARIMELSVGALHRVIGSRGGGLKRPPATCEPHPPGKTSEMGASRAALASGLASSFTPASWAAASTARGGLRSGNVSWAVAVILNSAGRAARPLGY